MRVFIIISCLITLNTSPLLAQPEIDLLQFYDGGGFFSDSFEDIYLTDQGDFFVCGSMGNAPCVMQLDSEGNVQWEFNDDGSYLESIIQADNGDAVAVGNIGIQQGPGTFGAIRIDPNGERVWRQEYFSGMATAIIELKNNNFLICGKSYEDNRWSAQVVMINAAGEAIWEQTYEADPTGSYFSSMRETEDGVVLVGRLYYRIGDFRHQRYHHGFILKISIDDEGDVIWTRRYALENPQRSLRFYSIISTDFGFAVGGSYDDDDGGIALYLVNAEGELLDNYIYETGVDSRLSCLSRLSDGGYILVGRKGLGRDNRMYPLFLRADSEGNIRWINDLSEYVNQQARPDGQTPLYNGISSVIVLPNDVIVGCGYLFNNDIPNNRSDAILIRLEPDQLQPAFFYWSPEDTVLTVLQGDTTEFLVRARDQQGDEFSFTWFMEDDTLSSDSTATVIWDEFGEYTVQCQASDGENISAIDWNITVSDFFISSYQPDTLNLFTHRNTPIYFSVIARSVNDDPVEYQWLLDDEQIADTDSVTIQFNQGRVHTVRATASQGEHSENIVWNVTILDLIIDNYPRDHDLVVTADTLLEFSIEPFDPEDPSLNIVWTLDGDSIDNRSWTFIDFDLVGEHQVAVHISDSSSADSMRWNVMVNPNDIGQNELALLPSVPTLYPPSPNPFNSTVTIGFALNDDMDVTLTVFDQTGRQVAILHQGQTKAGYHNVLWAAHDFPSGVYLCRLESANEYRTIKLALVK